MYFKMALNNVKKSVKDYSIYFLTLTFAVCIFYSFNSINSQSVLADLNEGQAQYIDMLNDIMSILSVGVSVILGCLIIYATNFLIKRRKKEFGVYMVLGMKKRSMSIILFLETFYIGIISLGAGLILGMFLAQILSILTAKLFVLEMTKYSFSISYEAIIKTIFYFSLMYIIVMIFNVICVSRYKLIDLLSAGKKNEKIKIKNIYVSFGILILSIAALGSAYYYIGISSLDFTKNEFKYSIALGIIGTLLFFYGISSVLFYMVSKRAGIYYNNLNCFSIRQISSKFNTNFLSMTVICLMLLITIGSLASGLAVKESMETTLKKSTKFDASIMCSSVNENKERIDPIEALKSLGYEFDEYSENTLVKIYYCEDIKIKDILLKYTNDSYKAVNEMMSSPIFDTPIDIIPISIFNNIREIHGENTIDLADDEILVANNYDSLKDIVNEFVKNENNVDIEGKKYKIKEKKVFDDSLYTSPTASVLFSFV
ncbi:MAG: ABC transporter permease, partial [Clostridium sp.]